MATPTKTIRLRPKLRAEIERIARRTRRSFSEVAQALLEEAIRTRECPGIYFADEPAGRVAKVAGTGLGVWEVIRDYKAVKGDEESCGGCCLISRRPSSRRRPSTTRGSRRRSMPRSPMTSGPTRKGGRCRRRSPGAREVLPR